MRPGVCRSCGARVYWIEGARGPVDTDPRWARVDKSGGLRLVGANGEVFAGYEVAAREREVACRYCGGTGGATRPGEPLCIDCRGSGRVWVTTPLQGEAAEVAGLRKGYPSHFSTCPQADDWRKRTRK